MIDMELGSAKEYDYIGGKLIMIFNELLRDKYRIEIDGEWSLRDLYEFPHVYAQLYSFLYVLELTPEDFDDLQTGGRTFTPPPPTPPPATESS